MFRTPPASTSGRKGPLVVVMLEGDVHVDAHEALAVVTVERAPVGLDRDAFVLDQLLALSRQFATLVGIRNGERLGQDLVEFGVGPTEFVPSLARAIGQRQICTPSGRWFQFVEL